MMIDKKKESQEALIQYLEGCSCYNDDESTAIASSIIRTIKRSESFFLPKEP